MDFLNNQGLCCKAKAMVLSLAEIILWASGLASTMQTRNESETLENLEPGLKTLAHNQREEENPSGKTSHPPPPEKIIHSYMVSKSLAPPPFSSCSSTMLDSSSSSGDMIGSESGIYMSSNDEEQLLENQTSYSSRIHRNYWNRRNVRNKEYPPPIPSLARTGNLLGRMPWVLTRHYTPDGRLVLKGVKVKRHEFFHAHRENGRLILKLIPLDFHARGEEVEEEEDEEDLELEDYLQFVDQQNKGKEKIVTEQEEEEEEEEEEESEGDDKDENSVPEWCSENNIGSNKTVGKFPKCYTYASGMFMDLNKSFCNKGDKIHERPRHTFLNQSTSAPLRPTASVM